MLVIHVQACTLALAMSHRLHSNRQHEASAGLQTLLGTVQLLLWFQIKTSSGKIVAGYTVAGYTVAGLEHIEIANFVAWFVALIPYGKSIGTLHHQPQIVSLPQPLQGVEGGDPFLALICWLVLRLVGFWGYRWEIAAPFKNGFQCLLGIRTSVPKFIPAISEFNFCIKYKGSLCTASTMMEFAG